MLSKRLKELREEKGYTQQEIASKIGLTKGAYGCYERGISVPDALTLLQLADIFDVTTDYLLGRVDNKKPLEDMSEKEQGAIKLAEQLTDEQLELITKMAFGLIKKD